MELVADIEGCFPLYISSLCPGIMRQLSLLVSQFLNNAELQAL